MAKKTDVIKNALNKDVSSFTKKYRVPLASILVLALLALVGIFVTYAYYQTIDETPIVGSTTGRIPDLDIRVMAEQRDANGNGLGSYDTYPYIPKVGYIYNEEKSYCTNGSVIEYDAETFSANVVSSTHDVCYLYFDSTANLDLVLEVYAENVDSNGEGTGEYTKLETTALPAVGYKLNNELSGCNNGSSLKYNANDNLFAIEASGKDFCKAYMDAIDVDINLIIRIQKEINSDIYEELNYIPTNNYYTLRVDEDTKNSTCTGTSTLTMKNQKVVISATSKTSCIAFLDIASGPIIESVKSTINNNSVTLDMVASNAGSIIRTWYYSTNGGVSYKSTNSVSVTLNNVKGDILVYGVDAQGNKSAIKSVSAVTNDYNYTGIFNYASSTQVVDITTSGNYELTLWGASNASLLGGYSRGTVYLNEGDTLYIHTGAKGKSGNIASSDIRINTDDETSRIIVAGGASEKGSVYTKSSNTLCGDDCLLSPDYYLRNTQVLDGSSSFASPYGDIEVGHNNNGYVLITYKGE